MNSLLHGIWRKLFAVCILLFTIVMIIRDRQESSNTLDQLQRRLLACTHHSDSLASQLEVIKNYKEAVERMLGNEKNTSKRVSQAYETKIQYLNSKSDNIQMQLNECQRGSKKSDDVVKLQTENDNYKRRVEELEQQVKQLNKQLSGRVNMIVKPLLNESNKIVPLASTTTSTVKSTTTTTATKTLVNPENHEDVEIQPVENPNFHVVPDTEIFFNKKPKEALVFRRDGDNEPPVIGDLLPHEELLKKINNRGAKKSNEDNVEDFRDPPKPDDNELDYKELDH